MSVCNPLRVCQLVASECSGGLGKHVVELANELAHQCDVTALCDDSYSGKFTTAVDHQLIDLSGSRWNPVTPLRLWLALRRLRPHVVHAHGNRAAELLSWIMPLLPAKCVGTVHWKLRKPRERRSFDGLDMAIGVSQGVLKDLRNPQQRVIYNGVPVAAQNSDRSALRARLGISPTASVAIAIGRMVKGKGFDVLLRAWQHIDGELLLVGDGPSLSELKTLAHQLELGNRVQFTGQVENAAALIPAADLVVIPSLSEGFSYVLAEALLYGVPIVSSDGVNGARELFDPSILVAAGDAQALASALRAAFSDLGAYGARFPTLFSWAGDHLTLRAMATNYFAAYQHLVSPAD